MANEGAKAPRKRSARAKRVYGEGNYEASRQYDAAAKEFIESGRVPRAARRAKPADEAEKREMDEAEQTGKSRAKEEDPALHHPDESGEDGDTDS